MVDVKMEFGAEIKGTDSKKIKKDMQTSTADAITKGIETGLKNSKGKVKNWSSQLAAALRDLEKNIAKADIFGSKGFDIDTSKYKDAFYRGTADTVIQHGAGATKEEIEYIKDINNQLTIEIENIKEQEKIAKEASSERIRALKEEATEQEKLANLKSQLTRAEESLAGSIQTATNKLEDSHTIMKDSVIEKYAQDLENLKAKAVAVSDKEATTTTEIRAKIEAIRAVRAQVVSYNKDLTQSVKHEQSWGKELAAQTKKLFTYLSASKILNTITQAIRKMVNEVIELDKAFTNIQMVTGYTDTQMNSLKNTCISLAQELKTTVDEVADAYNEWLRTGMAISEVNEAVTATIELSKIAGVTSSEATTMLISAMKGYKLEASDLISIVDKLSAVDMASASSSEDLANAMSKVAATAYNAGVEMDTLLGYIAKIEDVTQQSAETIGTAKYFWSNI